jgi:hypothetical protein
LGKVLGELNNDNHKVNNHYHYTIELHTDIAVKSKKGFYIKDQGERREIYGNGTFKFVSLTKLTYQQVIERFRDTKGIKNIIGDFATPYANDGNRKTVEDIEPVADTVKESFNNYEEEQLKQDYENKNHIEKIDWLRQNIQKLVTVVPSLRQLADYKGEATQIGDVYLYRCLVVQYLEEARFWLGFELGRCRKESKDE